MSTLYACDKCEKTEKVMSVNSPVGWIKFQTSVSGNLNDGKHYRVYESFTLHICNDCLGKVSPQIVEDLRRHPETIEDIFSDLITDHVADMLSDRGIE